MTQDPPLRQDDEAASRKRIQPTGGRLSSSSSLSSAPASRSGDGGYFIYSRKGGERKGDRKALLRRESERERGSQKGEDAPAV